MKLAKKPRKIITSFKTQNEFLQYFNHHPLNISSNECGIHDFKLRAAAGLRTQEHFTLHFVLRGQGTFSLAGKTYHCQENDLFMTPPNVKVCTQPIENDPWKYFWIGLNGTGIQELFEKSLFSTANPVYSVENAAPIRETVERLQAFLPATNEATRMRVLGAAFEILSIITQERTKNTPVDKTNVPKEYYMQKSIDYIESHYADPDLRIEEISVSLAVSHSYLCRIFKQLSGFTISQYLNQIRLREARILLEQSELSIESIAYEVGYTDYSHFSKTFKKTFLRTPGQYRALQQKNRKKAKK